MNKSDPMFCNRMLSYGFEKDHWLGQEIHEGWGFESKSEIWDGRRFSELQWFWNPKVISVQYISSSPDGTDGQKLKTCLSCAVTFPHVIQKVTGDPRNLANLLLCEGFKPFDCKYNQGSGAVEAQIANMCKEDRQKQSGIFVVGFGSAYLLPERRPISLDPFLSPLRDEIEDVLISSIAVDNYSFTLPDFPSGSAT